MTEVRPTRRPVEIVDPPDAVELVQRGTGVAPYPVQARLRLAVGADEAARVVPRTVGVHEADGPEATVVELGAGSVAGLAGWVAGLGVEVEVLGPPALREAVAAHGRRLADANRGAISAGA